MSRLGISSAGSSAIWSPAASPKLEAFSAPVLRRLSLDAIGGVCKTLGGIHVPVEFQTVTASLLFDALCV